MATPSLRSYQSEAVNIMIKDREIPGNSVLVLGTAAGKSHIIANYVKEFGEPTLILCPNREILAQNRAKLKALVSADDIGTYSASMKEKTIKLFTFATIGSIYRKASLFSHFSTVIVDECHTVRPDKYNSMYLNFFGGSKPVKIFGLTATPYINIQATSFFARDDDGRPIYETNIYLKIITKLQQNFWDRIIFNYDAKKLCENGYTVPVKYTEYHFISPNLYKLNSSKTEYDQDAYAKEMDVFSDRLASVCEACMEKYVSTLVFCSNVAQAEKLQSLVAGSEVVSAKTPAKKRDEIIKRFVSGEIKLLFNVSCLTTGFDSPRTDCLVILRPTKSLGLYQQFIGRGVRLSPETGKKSCKVIDLSATYTRLGAAEDIRIVEKNGTTDIVSSKPSIKDGLRVSTFRFKPNR